jgi:hypothetical protein
MGIFDSFNPLIKIAKQVVKSVQQGIMSQVNIVDTAVKAPVNAMIGQVVGGMWKGQGADAFVEVCKNLVLPETESIMSTGKKMNGGIQQALDIMEAADKKATGMVNDLNGVFRGIF